MERWKTIEEFPDYAISDHGRVKRIKAVRGSRKNHVLSPHIVSGYAQVMLQRNKKQYGRLVHRLVAQAFIGRIPMGKEVNHKDGYKINNSIQNLEYMTRSENRKHGIKNGLIIPCRGEQHGMSKLKPEEVWLIHKITEAGIVSKRFVAKMFQVHHTTICRISLGDNWKESKLWEN